MKPLNPLKKKRMELCLSREDIAERIGVSTQTVGDYETCKRNPKIKDIIYVCKVGYLMEDNEIIDYSALIPKDVENHNNEIPHDTVKPGEIEYFNF